jgi:hypothetical protein
MFSPSALGPVHAVSARQTCVFQSSVECERRRRLGAAELLGPLNIALILAITSKQDMALLSNRGCAKQMRGTIVTA